MFVYTTCTDCGGLLHTTDGDTVHLGCTPRLTRVEQLAELWLKAVETEDAETEARLQSEIDELDSRPPRLLDAAVKYAGWGWPVFPLKAQSKQPAIKSAHKGDPPGTPPCHGECGHEGHGLYDATTNEAVIRQWWLRYPNANIGLPTGLAFDVIDVDAPKPEQPVPGAIACAELLAADLIPDVHGRVCSARGGMHLYVEPSGDGNKAGIRTGIDYRGKGGYVVAPPSVLAGRRAYSWISKPSPVITGTGGTHGG